MTSEQEELRFSLQNLIVAMVSKQAVKLLQHIKRQTVELILPGGLGGHGRLPRGQQAGLVGVYSR